MYDSNIYPSPPPGFDARVVLPSDPSAVPGDVVFLPEFQHDALSTARGGVVIGRLACDSIVAVGSDVEAEFQSAETRRLVAGGVTGAAFAPGAIIGNDVSGVVPVSCGGTGVDSSAAGLAGRLLVGTGLDSAELPSGLTWDGSALSVPSLRIGAFLVSPAGASALLATGPRSAVVGGGLGRLPVLSSLRHDRAGILSFSASALGGENIAGVHLAAFPAGGRPRLPDEIASGTGATGHTFVQAPSPSNSMAGSADFSPFPPSTHVYMGVAEDKRGNLSGVLTSTP